MVVVVVCASVHGRSLAEKHTAPLQGGAARG